MDHARRRQQLRQIIERCTATARSPDLSVHVTVGPGGMMTALEFGGQASRHDGHSLGRLIVTTAGRAATQVSEKLAAGTENLTGGRVDVAGLLSGRLPDPPPLAALPPFDAGELAEDVDPATTRKLRQLREDAERRLTAYQAVRSQFAQQLTTVEAGDGSVRVTVRGPGVVEEVWIDDDAAASDMAPLAQVVLATIQSAYAEAGRKLVARTQELIGPALDIAGLVESYRVTRPDGGGSPGQAGGGQDGRVRR